MLTGSCEVAEIPAGCRSKAEIPTLIESKTVEWWRVTSWL